jgi:hypothetical protein
LAKLDSEYAAAAGFNVVIWLMAFFTWLSDFVFVASDPRYRVLVTRVGTEEVVGVAQARTRHTADLQMAQVEAILARSTEKEAREALGLDF